MHETDMHIYIEMMIKYIESKSVLRHAALYTISLSQATAYTGKCITKWVKLQSYILYKKQDAIVDHSIFAKLL